MKKKTTEKLNPLYVTFFHYRYIGILIKTHEYVFVRTYENIYMNYEKYKI